MNKPIRKASFQVAELGTRFSPTNKSIPKELLRMVDRPVIQYAVDEAVQAGCNALIFATGRSKRAIKKHLDTSPELENELNQKNNQRALDLVPSIIPPDVQCNFIRQSLPLGFGHVVLCTSSLAGKRETFAVVLPDDLIDGHGQGLLAPMVEQIHHHAKGMIAVETIPMQDLLRFSLVHPQPSNGAPPIGIADLVQKPPTKQAPSNCAIVGRYLLTKSVVYGLAYRKPGPGAEIRLNDALSTCAKVSQSCGIALRGRRFDRGSRTGFRRADLHYLAKNGTD